MKEGYIVCNTSNYGNEYFGVYRSEKQAERCLRRVIRKRFGSCPRDLEKLCEEPYIEDSESVYGIVSFVEFK